MFSIRPSDPAVQRYRASGVWRAVTVVDDVFRWAEKSPDAEAILALREPDGLVKLTYRDLATWVERFSAALAELDIGPGDVVSIQLPNWWQTWAVALACWRRAAVLAPARTSMRGRELEQILASTRAKVFITTDHWDGNELAATVAEMAPRLPALRHRVVLGEVVGEDEVDFVEFFQERPHPPVASATDPDAVAAVAFTSGTTGESKAALRTLNDLYAWTLPSLRGSDGTRLRRYTPQSLMHMLGPWSVMQSMTTGGASLLVDRWDARVVAPLLAETQVEQMILVPSMLGELLTAVRERAIGLPSLHQVATGGDRAQPELVAQTAEVLGLPLLNRWGMTEGGLILTSPEDPPDWAAHSIGRPGLGTEAQLRPVTPHTPLSAENPGRLMIRGGSVCLATMGRNSGTIRVLAEHDDGWYDSGDLAVPDGTGGYRLLGRTADRIGAPGMIPVADVEDALRGHPAITDVVVVGYRDNTEGCAVIVSTAPVSLADMRSYLSSLGMTHWYQPTRIERVEALPRNQTGKVEKARLRAWLAGTAAPPPASPLECTC